jgi:hypothetical protein
MGVALGDTADTRVHTCPGAVCGAHFIRYAYKMLAVAASKSSSTHDTRCLCNDCDAAVEAANPPRTEGA